MRHLLARAGDEVCEKGRPRPTLPPSKRKREFFRRGRGVIWNPFRSEKRAPGGPDKRAHAIKLVINLVAELLSVPFAVEDKSLREILPDLMMNKVAAGYIFGFHDACLQIYGLIDREDSAPGIDLIGDSYVNMFGEQAGSALFRSSLMSQADHDFMIGRQSGGEDFAEFKRNGTPPLGLQRIVSLGFDASMVERTLQRRS